MDEKRDKAVEKRVDELEREGRARVGWDTRIADWDGWVD